MSPCAARARAAQIAGQCAYGPEVRAGIVVGMVVQMFRQVGVDKVEAAIDVQHRLKREFHVRLAKYVQPLPGDDDAVGFLARENTSRADGGVKVQQQR